MHEQTRTMERLVIYTGVQYVRMNILWKYGANSVCVCVCVCV